jgi:hypothetical protein
MFHIGTPKTGTTYLQRVLADQRDSLRRQGWVYPQLTQHANQSRLGFAFIEEKEPSRQTHAYDLVNRERAISEIDAQLTAEVSAGQRWLMSSEQVSTMNDGQIAAFLEFLRRHFDEIQVIVYFRRRELLIPSFYSLMIKSGLTAELDRHLFRTDLAARDPVEVYESWCAAIGSENVIARPYLESYKSDSDHLLKDFCDCIGVSLETPESIQSSPRRRNERLSGEGVTFLRALNSNLPGTTLETKSQRNARARLITRVRELTEGPEFRLPPSFVSNLGSEVWDELNENNQRLVDVVGGGELWEQWLAQEPIEEGAQEINIEPKRVIEPLRELSYPKSVLDIGSEDWLPKKPTPPGRLRRIKRRLLN